MKKYWHKLSKKEQKEIIFKASTFEGLIKALEKFKKPDWCEYDDDLYGIFGCWSLIFASLLDIKINEEFCKDCDCYNGRKRWQLKVVNFIKEKCNKKKED